MHAKPDLRVFFEVDDRSFRLGDHGRYVGYLNLSASTVSDIHGKIITTYDPT